MQTACPEEPSVVKASHHDFLGFADIELEHRRDLYYPPYSCLSRMIFRGEIDEEVQAGAKQLWLLRVQNSRPTRVIQLSGISVGGGES